MIEIGERDLQDDSSESKIIEFDFDFAEKLTIKVRGDFRNVKSRINQKTKLNS